MACVTLLWIVRLLPSNPWFNPNVPDRVSGDCPNPNISGTDSGKMCEGGGATQVNPDLAPHDAEEAAVESQQQWRKHEQGMLPTHSRCDTSRGNGQQIENLCIHIHHDSIVHLITSHVYVIIKGGHSILFS